MAAEYLNTWISDDTGVSPEQKALHNSHQLSGKVQVGIPGLMLFEADDTTYQGFNGYSKAQYDLPKLHRQEASKNSARDPTCNLSDNHTPNPINPDRTIWETQYGNPPSQGKLKAQMSATDTMRNAKG